MPLRSIHYIYMVEHQTKGAKNMSEIQNAIDVRNLTKVFSGRVLFENFSLDVKANTIHAIIGPNGSGKTTLLRLITGVYQPNEGTINIAGKYAMQLENDYLYEEKTGLENLKIFGKYFGFEINNRSDSCHVRRFPGGLGNLPDKPFQGLLLHKVFQHTALQRGK